MKLEDFVNKVIINERAKEKYHVISTCEFCEHQGKWEPIDMCNNSANKDFGCIHWSERKEWHP